MEFAVVNNYMGPVATKVMKGYSEDDVRGGDDFKVYIYTLNPSKLNDYYYTGGGIEIFGGFAGNPGRSKTGHSTLLLTNSNWCF